MENSRLIGKILQLQLVRIFLPFQSSQTHSSHLIWQMMTNGIYSSVEHRATVNSEKERLSIATFYSPALDAIIGPAPSLVTPETPAVFKRISVVEYFRGYISQELRGKSFLDSIRIQAENEKSS